MENSRRKRVAILVHGFAGKIGFMEEIERVLNHAPFDKFYTNVLNLSFYSSKHGLDFSKPYDIRTPIYSNTTEQTLTHHLDTIINTKISELSNPSLPVDIFAHSMGGLVTRSLVQLLHIHNNIPIKNVVLMGTPNHGTRLAQKLFTIPADLVVTGLNILLELPQGQLSSDEWGLMKSQFLQMVPNSPLLKHLNSLKPPDSINWITIRGLKSTGQLGLIWQPFLFNKFWFSKKLPFIHVGQIPNDGLVEASSVPLHYATNLTVPEATHMDLLKWQSKVPGKQVKELLQPLLLNE